jgi:hypothetical protein
MRSILVPLLAVLGCALLFCAPIALAQNKYSPATTECTMVYNLSGWSLLVKRQTGEGTIRCSNGQRAEVKLEQTAIGLTAGKGNITGGKAEFSAVKNIKELFGSYAVAEAHAGASDSGQAAVLTKGEVSLTLSGTGKGVELGAAVGGFTITPK